jgi:hypothetical protein
MRDPKLDAFCDRIESYFFRWKGRPGVLSPDDFRRVQGWFDEGLHVEAVIEGISDAFEAHTAGRDSETEEINSLAYCEPYVRRAVDRRKNL